MSADIESLVETFDMNIESLKSAKNKAEAEIRKNYIDPMFESLGWNIRNTGLHEYEKEVVAEYPVKGELGTKKADYCFRLNGKDMFYVEAKDPYVNIETNRKAAFQIRSYCWSAKVPLGVLTDFEEFAVYDGGHEPRITDSTDTARTAYFSFKEYKDKWNEIAGVFSKEAVKNGSLDKYIKKAKRKKGIPVDETFLKDMEHWREILAVNIASLNPELARREINFAVQRIIDRIVFLRICEDRGTEPHGRIKRLSVKRNIYPGLVNLFREADTKYNSGIFCFAAEKGRTEGVDTLTPNLKIDDSVLKTVIGRLYYPSPYNFAVMPADILGQIYERFLGKVIEISPEREVSVEEKPEVRKAGGVYYTPTYIVNYIVENTIDRLMEGKTPAQVSKMRFLDPACGSGSFLIQAYQHLLNWHLAWYSENGIEKHTKGKRPVLVKDRKGNVRLSIDERKKILLNNIYGVDIDFQAVEVTKLSLLLKVLEGEDDLTMQQLGIFKERALPDLGRNIKCGNSLIGPDYYENVQMNLNDEEEILRVNAFDWNAEFTEIMENGGFDAVIGNPPYVRPHNIDSDIKNMLWKSYSTFVAKSDLYSCFMERGLILTKNSGFFSFIVPHTWTSLESFTKIREFVINNSVIKKLVQLPQKVFAEATVETCIFVLSKENNDTKKIKNTVSVEKISDDSKVIHERDFHQSEIVNSYLYNFQLYGKNESKSLIDNIKKNEKVLSDFIVFVYGFKTGDDDKFIHKEYIKTESHLFIRSANIKRYYYEKPDEYVWYVPDVMKKNKKTARPGDSDRFESEKIMVSRMGKSLIAAYDSGGLYVKDAMLLLPKKNSLSLLYLLGLINSRLLNYFYREFFITIDVLKNAILSLPIKDINFNNKKETDLYNKTVENVKRILELTRQLHLTTLTQTQTALQRQIEATDLQIDKLVYKLYDLTDDEIKTVEEQAA